MTCAHAVQFFDGPESLGADVAAFLGAGVEAGEQLLLLARPKHVTAIADALACGSHLRLEALVADGRLRVVDAEAALRELMSSGRPSPAVFNRLFAAPLRAAAHEGVRIRAYGELVDLLALDDNLRASLELEQLWNELIAEVPMTMLCGYTAATFADARCARMMERVCAEHGGVQRNDDDSLAAWLLDTHAPQVGATGAAADQKIP